MSEYEEKKTKNSKTDHTAIPQVLLTIDEIAFEKSVMLANSERVILLPLLLFSQNLNLLPV